MNFQASLFTPKEGKTHLLYQYKCNSLPEEAHFRAALSTDPGKILTVNAAHYYAEMEPVPEYAQFVAESINDFVAFTRIRGVRAEIGFPRAESIDSANKAGINLVAQGGKKYKIDFERGEVEFTQPFAGFSVPFRWDDSAGRRVAKVEATSPAFCSTNQGFFFNIETPVIEYFHKVVAQYTTTQEIRDVVVAGSSREGTNEDRVQWVSEKIQRLIDLEEAVVHGIAAEWFLDFAQRYKISGVEDHLFKQQEKPIFKGVGAVREMVQATSPADVLRMFKESKGEFQQSLDY